MVLPQRHRLRGSRVFNRIYRQSQRFHGTSMLLRVMAAHPALLPPPECHRPSAWRGAVVVSGKVSKRAVVRNRLRRLLHRHLLSLDPTPIQPSWVVLSLKPGSAELDPAQLLGECSHLLRQAGLTK